MLAVCFSLDGRQRLLRGFQMRNIDHLAVDAERARARIGRESGDDLLRMCDLRLRWRVAAVYRRHLIGMDRDAAGEAVTP